MIINNRQYQLRYTNFQVMKQCQLYDNNSNLYNWKYIDNSKHIVIKSPNYKRFILLQK